MKCRQTERQLKIESQTFPINSHPDIVDYMQRKGLQALPLVQILDTNSDDELVRLDEWNDFRPDKIKEWNKKHEELLHG